MLQRVSMEGLSLPRLYIAETPADVRLARENGLPYIRWKFGQEQLIKQLLRPTIERMFPGIDWNKVLGKRTPVYSRVVIVHSDDTETVGGEAADYDADAMLAAQLEYDEQVDLLGHHNVFEEDGEVVERMVPIADGSRICEGGGGSYHEFYEDKLSIADYVGDLSSSVDIEVLQKLALLPAFVGEIADVIKRNIGNSMRWNEGYNKKLGYPLGNFNAKPELPNLVIIDVSASIPDGIAATMLTLADTLRSNCNAELIITSARSGYYPIGAELPKPQTLRDYYGRCNESPEFAGIIKKHVAGRELGHVISFGDWDNPGDLSRWGVDLAGTKVHAVHHFHTWYSSTETGYARWAMECNPDEVEYRTDWCQVMKKNYRMGRW